MWRAAAAVAPALVGVKPLGDVERLELQRGEAAVAVAEALEVLLVPVVGPRAVVPLGPLQEEVGELTQAFLMRAGLARTKGRDQGQLDADFRAEIADVLCQTMLLARHHGVDIFDAVSEKWLVWESGRR